MRVAIGVVLGTENSREGAVRDCIRIPEGARTPGVADLVLDDHGVGGRQICRDAHGADGLTKGEGSLGAIRWQVEEANRTAAADGDARARAERGATPVYGALV